MGTKVINLPDITDVNDDDYIVFESKTSGTGKITVSQLLAMADIPENVITEQMGAGFHNSIYLEKDLTLDYYAGNLTSTISSGDFEGIYVGSYITGQGSGTKYLVGCCDYWYKCGDTSFTTHHLLMFPEGSMVSAVMNSTNTTEGNYTGSAMYTETLPTVLATIQADFPKLLTHRIWLNDAVTNGYNKPYSSDSSHGQWYDREIDLMNENMVYGSQIYSPGTFYYTGTNTTIPANYRIEKGQLPIFHLNPSKIICGSGTSRTTWWLRDVVSSADFAYVNSLGVANTTYASTSYGVRPAFAIA